MEHIDDCKITIIQSQRVRKRLLLFASVQLLEVFTKHVRIKTSFLFLCII